MEAFTRGWNVHDQMTMAALAYCFALCAHAPFYLCVRLSSNSTIKSKYFVKWQVVNSLQHLE